MISIVILIAIFANLIAPYEYDKIKTGKNLEPPNIKHILGTDQMGRDLFSRIIYGTRISLIVAFIVVLISFSIGTMLGLLAGYYSGIVDNLLMRLMDIIFSFPWVLVGLMLAAIMGPGTYTVIIALSIVYIPQFARIARSATLEVKPLDYIEAAKISGENNFKIILKYIFPNILSILIIQATISMSYSILGEAALSYIGYGTRPPTPSWGLLLQQYSNYLDKASNLVIFPGLAIVFLVLSFNFIGDGLRDSLDPRYRRIFNQ